MSARIIDRCGAAYPSTQLARRELSSGRWYELGYRRTRYGLVGIYRQDGLTRLTVISEGYQYERAVWRNLTRRGLAAVATRFARDVAEGTLEPERDHGVVRRRP